MKNRIRPIDSTARALGGVQLTALAFCLALAATPVRAADLDADLRVGVYTDASEAFFGGGVVTGMGQSGWLFNPNVEFVFVDRGDLATLNFDFLYAFDDDPDFDLWLGGGPALVLRESPRGKDETDPGLNLLARFGFLTDNDIRPFVQAKILLSDDSEAVLAFGIRFF